MAKSTSAKKSPASVKPRLVFRPEVLDRTGVAFHTIWVWMKEGKFPSCRVIGNKTAWLESEIDAWILSRPVRHYRETEGA